MAAANETGHEKNVAHFNRAYQIFEEMGALYNPTTTRLQLVNWVPIQLALATAINQMNHSKAEFLNAVAARNTEMKALNKRLTRTLNFAKSLALSTQEKDNLHRLVKKIRGDHSTRSRKTTASTAPTISTSHMSFDVRLANFSSYISQLASHEAYQPTDADLQIDTLRQLHTALQQLNQQKIATKNTLLTAQKKRNTLLYEGNSCVLQLIKECKAYTKALGPQAVPYYTELVKLHFRYPRQ